MDLTIESLRAGDRARFHDLMRQAFGGTLPYDGDDAPQTDADKVVCTYHADRLVGSVMTFDFAMTWGGRPVPCGGVSAVAVSPEVRGSGAARRMLAETFDRMDRRGQVLGALYPTTASLYRSTGFEVVGSHQRRRIPLGEIRTEGVEAARWREVAHDDDVLRRLHDDMSARHDGWFRVDPEWWGFRAHRQVRETSVNRYSYVGARAGADVAVVQYRYQSSGDFYDLEVEVVAGVDVDAVGAALALLAGHGTTAGNVVTTLPASVLGPHVPQLQRTSVASDWPWMLRVLDAPGAIAARGWPRSVSGSVGLEVVDPVRPANEGAHVLEVGGGEASLVRGGSGGVTVTAQDLAMLYSGCDVAGRRAAGRLAEATPDDLDLLAAAFVSNPTIPIFF